MTKRQTCRLCVGSNLEVAVPIRATPPGDHYVPASRLGEAQKTYPLDLFRCRDCMHAQLLYVINPDILYRNYIYQTAISLGLPEHFQQYAREVIEYTGIAKGRLIVDIGSNDGTFLKPFKDYGLSVLGIDPASEIAQEATRAGIETLPDYFTVKLAQRLKAERGPAAIITANNVIANIDDLDEIAEAIRAFLAPDGLFVFESGYLIDLIGNTIFDNIYHEHISYHSVKPFVKFFQRHGMQLIHVDHVPTKGGSIRGYVQLQGGSRKISPSVDEFVKTETRLGFDGMEPFKKFLDIIEGNKRQVQSLLTGLKKDGKIVAGYGASVGVTTLLYQFELDKLIDFLVDDNPARYDLYSPGYPLPVLPSQAIYDKKADCVLILAWRYAEPIMKKHGAFLKNGGRFILPLAEVKVIEK